MRRIGPYEVRGELGRGGMGSVFRAWHPELRREVAIKVLGRASPAQRRRFEREGQALAKLRRHPNVVQVLDAGEAEGSPYLVLDLVAGESLDERLQRGPLAPLEAARIGERIADALGAAHALGVLHRDLKPSNILLRPCGTPVLADFGLGKDLEREGHTERLTQSGILMGTPGFWAPEQAAGRPERVGPWTDLYGLGATLYAALTGESPFHGAASLLEAAIAAQTQEPTPPRERAPATPAALEALVLRMLAKEPEARPGSAAEVRDALTELLARPPRASRAPRALLALGAVLGSFLLGALLVRGAPGAPSAASSSPAGSPPAGGASVSSAPAGSPAPADSLAPAGSPAAAGPLPPDDPRASSAPTAPAAPAEPREQAVARAAALLRAGSRDAGLQALREHAFADFPATRAALARLLPDQALELAVASTGPPLTRPGAPLPAPWAALLAATPPAARAALERVVRRARTPATWSEVAALLAQAERGPGGDDPAVLELGLRLALGRGAALPMHQRLRALAQREGESARVLMLRGGLGRITGDARGAETAYRRLLELDSPLRDFALVPLAAADAAEARARLIARDEGPGHSYALLAERGADLASLRAGLARADAALARHGCLDAGLLALREALWARWGVAAGVPPEALQPGLLEVLSRLGGLEVPMCFASMWALRELEHPALCMVAARALAEVLGRCRTHLHAWSMLARLALRCREPELAIAAWAQGDPRSIDLSLLAGLPEHERALRASAAAARAAPAALQLGTRVRRNASGPRDLADLRTGELADAGDPGLRELLRREWIDLHLRRGSYAEVRRQLAELSPRTPAERAWATIRLGVCLARQRERERARQLFEEAAGLAPGEPEAALARAAAAVLGEPPEPERAEELVRAAILARPDDWLALSLLTRLRLTASEAEWRDPEQRARRLLGALLGVAALPADSLEAALAQGVVYEREGWTRDLPAVFEGAERRGVGGDDWEFLTSLGEVRVRLSDSPALGRGPLEAALRLNPASARARLLLAISRGAADPVAAGEVLAPLAQLDLLRVRDELPAEPWRERALVEALSLRAPPADAPLPQEWQGGLRRVPAEARPELEAALRAARDPARPWEREVAPRLAAAERAGGAPVALMRARLELMRGRLSDAGATLARLGAPGDQVLAAEADVLRAWLLLRRGRTRPACAAIEALAGRPGVSRELCATLSALWQGRGGEGPWPEQALRLELAPLRIVGSAPRNRASLALYERIAGEWGALSEEVCAAWAYSVCARGLVRSWPLPTLQAAVEERLASWVGDSPHLWVTLAATLLGASDAGLARWGEHLAARAAAMDPEHPYALELQGGLAARTDPDRALACFRRALAAGLPTLSELARDEFLRRYPARRGELEALLGARPR